jgi:hypothetical protein
LLTVASGLKESDFVKPDPEKNVSYRIWTLGEKNKPKPGPLRILVRSKTHAILVDRKPGMDPFQVIVVLLFRKILENIVCCTFVLT